MPDTPESLAAIAVAPPALPVETVAAAVREQFDLSGELTPLISERDQNFRLTADDGRRYVVKVVSRADSSDLVDFQVGALKYLEQQAFKRAPRIIDTVSGGPLGQVHDRDGAAFVLRLVSWLDGEVQRGADLSVAAAHHFGASIAEFDTAIAGFRHPGENQRLLWDIRRAPELEALVQHIDDTSVRGDVEAALQSFVENALPQLEQLPHQVIHNDLNGGNVLFASDRLVGIIDFGDMLHAPRIIDLAIAAAYLRDAREPLRRIAPLASGFAIQTMVSDAEKGVLFDLIRARLCTTIAMMYWRMSERPADDPYRQKTLSEESDACDFLAALNRLGRDEFDRQLWR